MLGELIQILGWKTTQLLVNKFGGTALYIPQSSDEKHPIARLIGTVGAAKLASYYGGSNIYLPIGKEAEM